MKSSNPEKNQEALDKFLTPLEILDFDYKATTEYGKVRADLEKKYTYWPFGHIDCFPCQES
jgi:tRNA(fMet)-specific endonuclease VapC